MHFGDLNSRREDIYAACLNSVVTCVRSYPVETMEIELPNYFRNLENARMKRFYNGATCKMFETHRVQLREHMLSG